MSNRGKKCECSRKKRINERKARSAKLQQALINNQTYEGFYSLFYGDSFDDFPDKYSIELPWDELNIVDAKLPRIISKVKNTEKVEERKFEPVKKVSSGQMHLPWEDITLTHTVQSEKIKKDMNRCDSWLEIPWDDILFDSNLKIAESDKELKKCLENDIEIPWNDILIPDNINLYPKLKYGQRKSKRHCGCSRKKI